MTEPAPWLAIVGIGEDGLDGVSPAGRALIQGATVLVGGDRHLALVPSDDCREILPWRSPFEASIQAVVARRGQRVCVLASGDPLCYGVGVTLLRAIPSAEITIVPAPSAFSLACSRLHWSFTEVDFVSLCGRDLAHLRRHLYGGARILALSADERTPAQVADLLRASGWGSANLTILERLGGPQERAIAGRAANWSNPPVDRLNLIAIACPANPDAPSHPPGLAGLPDSCYHHDGQLTKAEVRAITLATLAPLPGQVLWDVGAGCGSIAIEWLRSDRRCRAIAIEQAAHRVQLIAENAIALGTPNLQIESGRAPEILRSLPTPDAIFIGGGLTTPDLFATCWAALPIGGRLVANAVTVEGEQVLCQSRDRWGGHLSRIAIQRAEPIGKFLGWKPMAPVTQWCAIKT
ncbi:MAG: bifunctional cobalt-precorrin-7 (C(5))-methyltransferase/cobalt-precorrin-6B (C(15))-methyltransferase [Cyanophyceae cyanobacterium]